MASSEAILIQITPEDVRRGKTDHIRDRIVELAEDHDSIIDNEGKIIFDLDDVVSENEEPGENKELRKFFQQLDREVPYLPFFLSGNPEYAQTPLYASLIVPFNLEGESFKFDRRKLEKFAQDKIQSIKDLCGLRGIDSGISINNFCEQLNLEVVEENPSEEKRYPFKPEKITSESLLDFFKSGYYFHTVDASDEPVLFVQVDDPENAYYADAGFSAFLFESSHYPVIALEMSLKDRPDNPLKMLFVYDIAVERHLQELHGYTEMRHLLTYFLFRDEADELMYGFTRAIEIDEELRESIARLMPKASSQLRAIPKTARNFSKAVEELYRSQLDEEQLQEIEEEELEEEQPPEEEIENTPAPEPDSLRDQIFSETLSIDSSDKIPTPEDPQLDLPLASPPKTYSEEEEPEILQEIEILGESEKSESEPKKKITRVEMPSDAQFSSETLPAHIQKIARALSKPVRRPNKEITGELTIDPAPTRVIMREEDQMERMSRRFVIIQNRLDQSERESLRMRQETGQLRDEIERLERENLALKQRWWKFWK